MRILIALLLVGLGATVPAAEPRADFDPGILDYTISFDGMTIAWSRFAFFVMPGEPSEVRVDLDEERSVKVLANAGELEASGSRQWTWRAPLQPGAYTLTIQPQNLPAAVLHLLVQVPADQAHDGDLNGYRIGRYPQVPLRDDPIYLPPAGFIEVHPDMFDLPVSPHFTLGQFLCKQQPDQWPKYMILREALVAKLEMILAEVNQRGIRTDSFVIMSGYRTPWYNRSIGNVPYSRHVWGGAADIFIDNTGDGVMDDLNRDGHIGVRDARVLLDIVNDMYHAGRFERLVGGLGLYGPRRHRGPFVHVDARGEAARWETP